MSQVFISYRRNDSAQWADKLYRHLSLRFGKDLVFEDVDSIEPGEKWLDAISQELSSCLVMLVIIGRYWLNSIDGTSRLNDPDDVLRMEIVEALTRKTKVIPVLVDSAVMPDFDALPEPLKPLASFQAVSLRARKWRGDVQQLIEHLRKIILPTAAQATLESVNQEVYSMQVRYFEFLDRNKTANALELAQKTQSYLNRVMPLHPQNSYLKVTRGYIFKNEAMALLRLERYPEADTALDRGEEIFRTMLDEQPKDAGAWNGLGSIEAVRGNYELALRHIEKALKILPNYPEALQDREQILNLLGR